MRGEVNADSDDDFASEMNPEKSGDAIIPPIDILNDSELEISEPVADHASHSVPQLNILPSDDGMIASSQSSDSLSTTERQDSHNSQESQGNHSMPGWVGWGYTP